MKGKKLSVISLLFLLVFYPLSYSYSEEEVRITITEWNQLKEILNESKESNLNKMILLEKLKKENENNINDLSNLKILNEQMSVEIQDLKNSLEQSKKETKLKILKSSIIGVSIGASITAIIYSITR